MRRIDYSQSLPRRQTKIEVPMNPKRIKRWKLGSTLALVDSPVPFNNDTSRDWFRLTHDLPGLLSAELREVWRRPTLSALTLEDSLEQYLYETLTSVEMKKITRD